MSWFTQTIVKWGDTLPRNKQTTFKIWNEKIYY